MKLVSKSLNRLSIEPLARKNGKEHQKWTFTKIHSADQVGWLVSWNHSLDLEFSYDLEIQSLNFGKGEKRLLSYKWDLCFRS